MKEVLTKAFWEGVKKTFEEARDNPPPAPADNAIPEAANEKDTLAAETPAVEAPAAKTPEANPADKLDGSSVVSE